MPSYLETAFLAALTTHAPDLPTPTPEFRFHPKRRWRADFAWEDERVLVEIEGIYGTRSRHRTALGYHNDCEKYRAAVLAGYAVLRYTSRDLATAEGCRAVAEEVANFVRRRTVF